MCLPGRPAQGRWILSIAILEKFCYTILVALHGKVSEWFKELVLKTSDAATHRGFESHPFRHIFLEKRRRACWYQKPIVMRFVAVFDHWRHSPLLRILGKEGPLVVVRSSFVEGSYWRLVAGDNRTPRHVIFTNPVLSAIIIDKLKKPATSGPECVRAGVWIPVSQ